MMSFVLYLHYQNTAEPVLGDTPTFSVKSVVHGKVRLKAGLKQLEKEHIHRILPIWANAPKTWFLGLP